MSSVKVVANVNETDYELNSDGDTYSDEIVAPFMSEDIMVTATDESGNSTSETTYLEVNNEWLSPKTDWTASDYFNASDYNRIIGNISYLRTYLSNLFLNMSSENLGSPKTYESLIFAREINAIESALEKLNSETYSLDIGEAKEYKANKPTPLYTEFNRIESALLLIYETMDAHKENIPKLSFRLGARKEIKV